jgi:hypothetical protein
MFTLYLKTHRKTGLKYLGYTKNDPFKYRGSGKYWKDHIKKHGNDVLTEILFQSDKIDEISAKGLEYSVEWNIAESQEFANHCFEDGNKGYGNANINFKGHPQTEETRKKISQNNGRGNKGKFGKDHPSYGHKMSDETKAKLKMGLMSYYTSTNYQGPWNKGKKVGPHTDDRRRKISLSANKDPKDKIQCPHCHKIGGKPAMLRFHFDKCKEYKQCVVP